MTGRRASRIGPEAGRPIPDERIPEGGISAMKYRQFTHRECEFFPCHDLTDWRSCLFCWCPLYTLECGGDAVIRNGVKDCSPCTIPHGPEGYEYIMNVVRDQIFGKG
jgi:Zn-finger protein